METSKNPKFTGFEKFYEKYPPLTSRTAIKYRNAIANDYSEQTVKVASEETVAIIINDRYRVNILCTPGQIEALCVGYLICEGLIESFDEIEKIDCKDDKVMVYTKSLIEDFFSWVEIRSSGCVGIKEQYKRIDFKIESELKISAHTIFEALKIMTESSKIWPVSGGSHMSALFRGNGEMAFFSEDIGRHNTIDKIVGQAAIDGGDRSKMFAVTSGRISAATVSKIARAGIPVLISISAPLAEGLKLGEKADITLVGFARDPAFNIYTFPQRIIAN
jgi:formate dehydrogenase accessory protein FdhD